MPWIYVIPAPALYSPPVPFPSVEMLSPSIVLLVLIISSAGETPVQGWVIDKEGTGEYLPVEMQFYKYLDLMSVIGQNKLNPNFFLICPLSFSLFGKFGQETKV